MPPIKLVTKAQWDKMSPSTQGYVLYTQGAMPGSELRDLACPYPRGSKDTKEFASGEFAAMMDAQDGGVDE